MMSPFVVLITNQDLTPMAAPMAMAMGGHGDFRDCLDDLAANQKCIAWEAWIIGAISWLYRESCECCCKKVYP
jgi:hypothetical protein